MITEPFNLLLVPALLEHVIGLLLVECAAHAAIGGVHREDAGAIQRLPLPYTALDQGPRAYNL